MYKSFIFWIKRRTSSKKNIQIALREEANKVYKRVVPIHMPIGYLGSFVQTVEMKSIVMQKYNLAIVWKEMEGYTITYLAWHISKH